MWIPYFLIPGMWMMALVASGQPGSPDLSFGQDGQIYICTGESPCFADDIVLTPGGGFLVAGSAWNGTDTDFAVWRFHVDGSLDSTFGVNGVAVTDIMGGEDRGQAVALRPIGGIVIAGYGRMGDVDGFALAAFDEEGELDDQFGDMGVVRIPFGSGAARLYDLAIQPDGKIVAAGVARIGAHNAFIVLRALPHGSPDPDFGIYGVVTTSLGGNATAFALALQPDGRILLAGQARVDATDDFAVVRYLPNGNLDASFGTNGITLTDIGGGHDTGYALGLQPDGRILVGGVGRVGTQNRFALVRYEADGTVDLTFGEEGIVTASPGMINDIAHSIAVQEDGRIVLAGRSPIAGKWHFSLVRFNGDGTTDETFGEEGVVLTNFDGGDAYGHAVALQPDGRILMAGSAWVAGSWYVGLCRYHSTDLSPVAAYPTHLPLEVYPNPTSGILYLDEMLNGRYEVWDPWGRLVQHGHLTSRELDLSALPAGMYMLRVVKNDYIRTGTVLKK